MEVTSAGTTLNTTYLRMSVTDRCDQHCIYCSPQMELISHQTPDMSPAKISCVVAALAQSGITKVRITGGEPLLRKDLPDIVAAVSGVSCIRSVRLTTNGFRLAAMVGELKSAGLDGVNISIDSLDEEIYAGITGRDCLGSVLLGLDAAIKCGFHRVKTNTVVMRGINDCEIPKIAALTRELPIDVRFIELMPLERSPLNWGKLFVPAHDIREMLGDIQELPYEPGNTAKLYRMPGAVGRIGVIAPVSESFCHTCNRIRLTCRGWLKPCLRSSATYDVLSILDHPDGLTEISLLMKQLGMEKSQCGPTSGVPVPLRSMSLLGG